MMEIMQLVKKMIGVIDRTHCVNFLFDSSRIALRGKNNIRLSPRVAITVTNFSRSGFGIRRGKPTSDRSGSSAPRFSKTPRHSSFQE